jgi:hypothetical protein
MRGVLRSRVEEVLSVGNVERSGLLDARAVQESVRQFMCYDRGVSAAGLWHILQLQSWSTRWGACGVSAGSDLG